VSQTLGPAITKKKLFIAGLVAGAIAVAVSLVMRLLAGGSFLPEIASQTLFSLTPGQVEFFLWFLHNEEDLVLTRC
jgi:hypothetical protein